MLVAEDGVHMLQLPREFQQYNLVIRVLGQLVQPFSETLGANVGEFGKLQEQENILLQECPHTMRHSPFKIPSKQSDDVTNEGIIEPVVFLLKIFELEVGMSCRQVYQPETRTIIDRDGNILAEGTTKTFHIPTFEEMEMPTIEEFKMAWDDNSMGYNRLINHHWLKEKRGSAVKVPQELFRNDFHEDYHDLVTMLSWVMGLLTVVFFQ